MRLSRVLALLCAVTIWAPAQVPWPTAGWQTSTPEAEGMRTAKLEEADAWLRQRAGLLPGSEGGNRYSFLVVRNGRIVFERYYNGASAGDALHVASVSKSLLSGLAGIAVGQGIISLDEKWFDTFPQYRPAVRDPRTLELSARNILMMTGGLEWREDRDIVATLFSPEWLTYVLSRGFIAPPGEAFNYSTGLSHTMSALLAEKSHLTTREFAERNLFGPIGMRIGDWWTDPKGYHGGGWGMHTTARDLAKFGYLYLHEGEWNGQQIVPREWIRVSTSPLIRSGSGDDDFYGYFWRMDNRRGFFMPDASGMGDQHLWYSRDLDLVVVTTGKWDYLFETGDMWHLMHDFVVPAVFSGPPAVNSGGVVNAAGGRTVAAPDSFVSIYGTNLAPVPVSWDSVILDGATLPVELGAVSVKVSGKPAWLSYSGPDQVNIVVPPDVQPGTADVEITHPGGTFKTTVTVAPVSPGLF
ncbi:MAG TPA: serine hydrolase, partial [Bryobacteraceae bacterium]|nr:serine hydrolase [Bryobacteraceae bacterium]